MTEQLTLRKEDMNLLSQLQHSEGRIERATRNAYYEVGTELRYIRDHRLYRLDHKTFPEYCLDRWDWTEAHVTRLIQAATFADSIKTLPIGKVLPTRESHIRPLLQLEAAKDQQLVWQRVVDITQTDGQRITAKLVEREVSKRLAELDKRWYTLDEWGILTQVEQQRELARADGKGTFNRTNDNVDWAWWTWNPVTGCRHGCPYCYAEDIANRFNVQGFDPSIWPDRFSMPFNQIVPNRNEAAAARVFVCSMADLFGEWVPQEWIEKTIDIVRASPQWTYIFLTKNPVRLIPIDWPDNAWVGTTVDFQHRVKPAEEAFAIIQASKKIVSCEPIKEQLIFEHLDYFDSVIMGGQTSHGGEPPFQPKADWVVDLYLQAREANCRVYGKPNLDPRWPKEL